MVQGGFATPALVRKSYLSIGIGPTGDAPIGRCGYSCTRPMMCGTRPETNKGEALHKTVVIKHVRGRGEREAVAEAWARLNLQGYVVLDVPAPVVEEKSDDAGGPLSWAVTFSVERAKV